MGQDTLSNRPSRGSSFKYSLDWQLRSQLLPGRPLSGAESSKLIADIWWCIGNFVHGCPERFAVAILGSFLGVNGADLVEFLDERRVKELVERFVEGGSQSFGVEVVGVGDFEGDGFHGNWSASGEVRFGDDWTFSTEEMSTSLPWHVNLMNLPGTRQTLYREIWEKLRIKFVAPIALLNLTLSYCEWSYSFA